MARPEGGEGPDSSYVQVETADPHRTILFASRVIETINTAIREHAHASPVRNAEIGGVLQLKSEGPASWCVEGAELLAGKPGQASWSLNDPAQIPEERPLGLFRSHTRKDLSLSREDLELCDRYRPVLFCLIRPFTTRPNHCAVYLPERYDPDTPPHAEVFFEVQGGALSRIPPVRGPRAPAGDPGLVQPQYRPVPAGPDPDARRKWLTVCFIAAVVGGSGGFLLYRFEPRLWNPAAPPVAARSGSRLALSASGEGHLITLQWDPAARVVERARSGSLWVSDGGNLTTKELSQTQLRTGLFVYSAVGEHLLFRLTVSSDREQVSESISFEAQPEPAPPPAPLPEQKPL